MSYKNQCNPSKDFVCMCVCTCVCVGWTFVHAQTAAWSLFMLMYLTCCLIAPGWSQLPTVALSYWTERPDMADPGSAVGHDCCCCVLFAFAQLRLNSVNKHSVCWDAHRLDRCWQDEWVSALVDNFSFCCQNRLWDVFLVDYFVLT